MYTHKTLKPSLLALAVAAVISGTSQAQTQKTSDDTEVIQVSGIRGSLVKAMDIKRDADGVVDAISAEDIGKFPDTNLAESLQRITGVSIDRQNNEGSRVTVRGWGPEFNLITLNGRQMPAANLSDTSANSQRSYDFANLAAESVSGVEVYKTGKANLTTGGIGSTINILTHKPLLNPGLIANVGIKALMDDSRLGDDITPEISGIFSNTFADNTVGISLVASQSKRDNFAAAGQVSSGWNSSLLSGVQNDPFGAQVYDAGGDTVIYTAPQNYMYSFEDFSRTRTNAQLTLQYQPFKALTATVDYTYSELEQEVARQELSVWFGSGNYASTSFTDVDAAGVVSPLVLNNSDCCDFGYGVGAWRNNNENKSLGLNLKWQVNNNLNLSFDAHDSTAEAQPNDDRGSNNIVTAATFRRTNTVVDFSKSIPTMVGKLDNDQALAADGIIASGNSYRNGYMKTEIKQYQLDGKYVFDDGILSSIDFGASQSTIANRSAFSLNQGGDWGGIGYTGQTTGGGWNSPAGDGDDNFRDSAFTVDDLVGIPGPDNLGINGQMVWVDYDQFTTDIASMYANNPNLPGNVFSGCPTGTLCANAEYSVDRRLKEEQTAFYVQANMAFELGSMASRFNIGLRHESTDVTSDSLIPNYTSAAWLSANELLLNQDGGVFAQGIGSYSYTLPNVDFSIELSDELLARASVSKTLARPGYDDLQAGSVPGGSQARTFDNSPASSGNPNLKPFESNNLDLSIEYYYDEGNYISLGYYKKDVKNFIGDSITQEVIYPDLVNPASGTRLAEAQAAVVNPANAALEIRNYYVAQGWVAADGSLTGDLSVYDPLSYTVTLPVNQENASVDGFEFAVQHIFGESGLGLIANYTTVDGDVTYDNSTVGQDQFALLGLSDTANLVAFYDKNGIQLRLAYNWRDEFLSATGGGNGQFEPAYTEAYSQLDMSINYAVNEQLSVSFEGINITEQDRRVHARGNDMVIYAAQQSARYSLGLRYKF